ncbi:MAG: beta-Ala-His dipeptidase [Lachnospiraceae bacterium]|nr:beta-Ala-His dipeptidase [Lachnospiraceae bacterium]
MGVLEGLEPESVFGYFEEICRIPRMYGELDKITNYLIGFAKTNELEYKKDDAGNVIIYKEAAMGYEGSKPVLLQAHMDMVCENDYDYDARYDVSKEGVTPAIIDDLIYAKGSSLGSIDGVGMAYILSVLADKKAMHPRIEAMFTADRYDSMKGVSGFDSNMILSRRMISFSHFNEGELLNSSAGSRKVICKVPVRYEKKKGILYDLVICGLMGGHAGLEIDQYRGNANILMGRLLHYIDLSINFELNYLKGGMQYDSIPREAKASVLIREEDINILEDIVDDFARDLQKEYYNIEENLTIYCENKGEGEYDVLTSKTNQRVIFLLMTIPDGIARLCPSMQSVVQTSSNTGIIELDKNDFVVRISIRSQLTSEKHALSDKLRYLTETIGGAYEVEENFHSWEYISFSPMRKIAEKVYNKKFFTDILVTGTHDSTECGIITDKIRDMDIIVIGTAMENINTTKERLSINSVERTYGFLLGILEELKE